MDSELQTGSQLFNGFLAPFCSCFSRFKKHRRQVEASSSSFQYPTILSRVPNPLTDIHRLLLIFITIDIDKDIDIDIDIV